MKIKLSVRNQGQVPSFKTQKRAAIHRVTGHPMIVTTNKHKKWMRRCVESFELQLFCATRLAKEPTQMAPLPPCSIASLLPEDDSRHHIGELIICSTEVNEGDEGADIIIEPLPEIL